MRGLRGAEVPSQSEDGSKEAQTRLPLDSRTRRWQPRHGLPGRAIRDCEDLKKELGPGLLADICK